MAREAVAGSLGPRVSEISCRPAASVAEVGEATETHTRRSAAANRLMD